MEDKAIRKGLSVTAIVLIVISCLLLSFNDTHEKLFGRESTLYGIPFIFAFAIPLIAILIILTRYYNNTDTMEEMIGAIAVRYSIFGWLFVFVMRLAGAVFTAFFLDFYKSHSTVIQLLANSLNVAVICSLFTALALRGLPKVRIEKRRMKFKQLLLLIMMMYGMAQIGNMMGMPLEALFSLPVAFSPSNGNALEGLQSIFLSSDTFVRVITVGIIPPVFEELIFRKFMIDRTIRHGEFISCAMSGLMFGLWHGNFQQFFYAFFVGVLFAFVYIRTGNIIYTMILHASMNLVTSTITIELLVEFIRRAGISFENGTIDPGIDEEVLLQSIIPILLLIMLWVLILFGFEVAGFILLIVKRKNFKLVTMEGEPGRKAILHKMTHSVAMWVFFAFVLLRFTTYYLPDFLALIFR